MTFFCSNSKHSDQTMASGCHWTSVRRMKNCNIDNCDCIDIFSLWIWMRRVNVWKNLFQVENNHFVYFEENQHNSKWHWFNFQLKSISVIEINDSSYTTKKCIKLKHVNTKVDQRCILWWKKTAYEVLVHFIILQSKSRSMIKGNLFKASTKVFFTFNVMHSNDTLSHATKIA